MTSSYLNKYKIVQTFKENDLQKVFIGTDNKNNQAVVINTIYVTGNDSAWDLVEKSYESIFDHIIHFERMENQIVFVTTIEEGLSLNTYLKDFSPSFTERVNLIHQYLNYIKKYDLLPNNIKSILVDESQIIVNEGKLSFDELIIFNENSLGTNSFEPILDNIVLILKKLTSLQAINYGELPLYIEIIGFLDDLQKNKDIYNNINKIFNDLEKLNINNLSIINEEENILGTDQSIVSSDATDLVGRKVGSIDEEAITAADMNKKRILTRVLATAGVVIIATVGVFALKSILPLDGDTLLNANIASKAIIDTKDLDEDLANKNVVTENMEKEAVGPNSDVNYISEYIKEDFTTSKYGDYSFKISSDDSTSHKLSINTGPIKTNSQLLMWVKLDMDSEIKIDIEGYSNDKLSFQQSISHKPLHINSWELVQLTFDANIDDYIDITINDISGIVWIDKISIDIFK